MTRWVSEFVGTFVLVFFGTGALAAADTFPGLVSHAGVAAVFGLAVMAMIYAIGDVSGAHINPAVTVSFWLARRLHGREVVPYVVGQLLGAVAASGLLHVIYPSIATLGVTHPNIGLGLGRAFAVEVLLSFVLMFVILHVAQGAKEKGIMAGIAVGGTVAMEALVAGPLTGASMDSARSLGPALVSGSLGGLWIYLVAPLVGAALAVLSCRLLRERCCTASGIAGKGHD